jgi:hypothetical protein
MKTYPDHNGREIEWPDDYAEPLAGANASPLAGRTKFDAMKADIKRRGLREKIKLTRDGKIAEGRNRYRALRELGWSHKRVVEEAAIFEKASDHDAAMSNIMRVNRTNFGLIASYLIANPKALEALLKDRNGCSSSTVQRVLDACRFWGGSSYLSDPAQKNLWRALQSPSPRRFDG